MMDSKSWKWDFAVKNTAEQFCFSGKGDGKTVLNATFENGILCAAFYFSLREKPLCVKAEAKEGCIASIVYRPYRIELFIDGVLCDEEWQFGEPLFFDAEPVIQNTEITESPAPAEEEQPTVCGSFVGAEGWKPGNGVFVGDCMPYSDGKRYHVLYLKDRHRHGSKWGKGAHQWEHLSTDDLIHWDIHPMAVAIDDPSEGSICTGSWIYDNGKYYLYYSVRSVDGTPAPLQRSVSDDGYHFHKDREFRFILSERYFGATARDPKVVRGEDGLLHMFVSTTDLTVNKGCLAHLISRDNDHFEEIGNIYTSADESEPECSDYIALNGKYYLIFSLRGRGHYLISDQPFSDWKEPADPIIPCSTVPKCAVWNGRIIFTGFSTPDGDYAGTMTFMEAIQTPDGTFTYRKVKETEESQNR